MRGVRLVAREPLAQFFAVGLLVFLAAQGWRAAHADRRIVVTPAIAADLATKHQMQFGSPPTQAQLDRLVANWVDEEVLYRSGKAQGLDQGDEIVRRRVAQKAQFLLQDLHPPREPDEAELRAWYGSHPTLYSTAGQFSFSHLFFSPNHGGDDGARARAAAALKRLEAGAPVGRAGADVFPDLDAYADLNLAAARRVFGDSELTRALPSLPLGAWSGPLRSPYGWHLVKVAGRTAPSVKSFDALRDQVRGDVLDEAQRQANAQAFAALRARYIVVRRDRAGRP